MTNDDFRAAAPRRRGHPVPHASTAALLFGGVVLAIVVASGCGTTSSPPPAAGRPAYEGFGPRPVGVTTLDLSDRQVEVWYPTESSSVAGRDQATYVAFEVLPPSIVALLPADLNLVIGMDAWRDVPVSARGPFPVVTFSHGAGGFRQAYSGFLARLASHGLVVASIDHPEWGLLEQVGLRPADAVDRTPGDVLRETLAGLEAASGDPASPLRGGVDAKRVATTGHSAGGRTAFALPDLPGVRAMIGYATGRDAAGVRNGKSVLLLAGDEDDGLAALEETYDVLPATRRFVAIGAAGHNSFTDQCTILHGGNDFLGKLVEAGFPIPANLLLPARDGCRERNLAPARFQDVATHFTVAHVRAAFGLDAPPVGLDDGVAGDFPGIAVRYRHEP